MATKFRKRMPNEKHYTQMRDAALANFDANPYYSAEAAVEAACQIVRQRRAADKKAIGLPAHWPAFETPLEHNAREMRMRQTVSSRDDAERALFAEEVQTWRAAEPAWNAHEITVHIMDRGHYVRYGYAWGLRIAQEIMSGEG